jgi:predicted nucleic acid-binding protein
MIGTLGLLLVAKTRGIIPTVRDPLDRLRNLGMRLSDSVRQEVLGLAGESST